MSHWRKQREMILVIEGATTRVVLRPSEFGWEVKGWTHSIGNAKSVAEGDTIFGQTYGSKEEAVLAFTELCQASVIEPYQYQEPIHPRVSHETQDEILSIPIPAPFRPTLNPPPNMNPPIES